LLVAVKGLDFFDSYWAHCGTETVFREKPYNL